MVGTLSSFFAFDRQCRASFGDLWSLASKEINTLRLGSMISDREVPL